MVPTIIWRGLIVFASLKKSENCGSCVTEVTAAPCACTGADGGKGTGCEVYGVALGE